MCFVISTWNKVVDPVFLDYYSTFIAIEINDLKNKYKYADWKCHTHFVIGSVFV